MDNRKGVGTKVEESWLASRAGCALGKALRNALPGRLEQLRRGRLILVEDGKKQSFGRGDRHPVVTVHVRDPRFYTALVLGGSVGASEAYMLGYWWTDDLVALFQLMLRNEGVLAGLDSRWSLLPRIKNRLYDWSRRNTLVGSRRNILDHYDLSNEFYSLFLDPTLTYSSGIFPSENSSLEEASLEKLDRLCRKLELREGQSVLEIGTGWGSFAIHAAENYGVHVTTTTISDAQYRLAARRVAERGLEKQVTLLKRDYRHLSGQYDHVVSIEMIEAVGHAYMGQYVQALDRHTAPGGRVALQAITINDQVYDTYRKSVDFIKRYIFPGGNLVSLHHLIDQVKKRTSLRLTGLEAIGQHYAKTLRIWRNTFLENLDQVRQLGFGEPFIRMWEYYLASSEAGFLEKGINDFQIVLEKPEY